MKSITPVSTLCLHNIALPRPPPPSLDTYRSYIARAKSNKEDGTFVNTLYQRAVAHHCLNADLWKEYITFLVGGRKEGPVHKGEGGRGPVDKGEEGREGAC